MTDVKWIKIVTDIFDDEKILLIESMPDADAIIVIWFKLLCLAGKQNNGGVFMLNDRIPYTDDMFATIFRRKKTTVDMALKIFEQFGMIEIINNTVTIPNWSKHQSLDAYERRKERDREYQKTRYHEKKAQLLAATSTDTSTEKSTDTSSDGSSDLGPLDKEEEIDKEEDKKKNKKSISNRAAPSGEGTAPAPDPAVYLLPLNDGSTHGITAKEIDSYSKLYPAVDVPQEIRKMIGWLDANPAKRKTRRGIKNFINGWLSREQDKGGKNRPVYGSGGKPPQPPKPYADEEDFYG